MACPRAPEPRSTEPFESDPPRLHDSNVQYNRIFQRPGIAFNPAFHRMLHPIQATRNNRLKDKMFHPPVKLVFDRFTESSHKFSLSLVPHMPFLHSIHSWAANLLHCPSPLHHTMRTLPLPFFNSLPLKATHPVLFLR